jgi:hypothetical protein
VVKSKKAEFMKAKTFLDGLQEIAQLLPTEAEKAEAKGKIGILADFLETMRAAVDAMPSIESARKVNDAVAWLQGLFSKAETNPVLAGLVAPPAAPRPRKRSGAIKEQDLASAKLDVSSLKTVPIEQIRNQLFDETLYSLTRLRAMAASVGIGAANKLGRESLAHQITTKVANTRGYETLSGKGEAEKTE